MRNTTHIHRTLKIHQDSMGIYFYLAPAEELTEGYIDLIIMDDVMMMGGCTT
jgi:hypothetical protein